jgi:hypothetical protein
MFLFLIKKVQKSKVDTSSASLKIERIVVEKSHLVYDVSNFAYAY